MLTERKVHIPLINVRLNNLLQLNSFPQFAQWISLARQHIIYNEIIKATLFGINDHMFGI